MSRPGYDEVTLLTGFPSFLARKLAAHILELEPRTFVHAVVRAKLAREAQETVLAWPKSWRDRFAMIDADAPSMVLGLPGAESLAITAQIDRIHHAAQG